MAKKEPTVTLTLRVPITLHAQISIAAEKDKRTINGWANKVLEEYLKNQDAKK